LLIVGELVTAGVVAIIVGPVLLFLGSRSRSRNRGRLLIVRGIVIVSPVIIAAKLTLAASDTAVASAQGSTLAAGACRAVTIGAGGETISVNCRYLADRMNALGDRAGAGENPEGEENKRCSLHRLRRRLSS
jgi:hypothetical protein